MNMGSYPAPMPHIGRMRGLVFGSYSSVGEAVRRVVTPDGTFAARITLSWRVHEEQYCINDYKRSAAERRSKRT